MRENSVGEDTDDRAALVEACRAHGIDDTFTGIDGVTREVPTATLAALAEAFDIEHAEPQRMGTIEDALAEDGPAAHVPDAVRDQRIWGFSCQLGSLRSKRNWGIGDLADLAELCRTVARMGADFVGLNPLHALFTANPAHASPFSPSNRRMWNPLYIAPDRVEGFDALDPERQAVPERLHEGDLIDHADVAHHKLRLLWDIYHAYPWTPALRREYDAFLRAGGEALRYHAMFEAISHRMARDGHGAGWMGWPANYDGPGRVDALAFEAAEDSCTDYHAWLQWIFDRQLADAARAAREAGMRVGLYLDLAVGAAPDGSATWSDPSLTVPGLHVGAPPDPFSDTGQDWGLAPMSPVELAAKNATPIADMLAVAMRHAGAVRVDHAMGLARLWLIPAGSGALDGAYVRYPLRRTLAALAGTSERLGCMVIGEDLGVVPEGFRPLMEQRDLHAYKVFFFERDEHGFRDPTGWGRTAMACVGTHDTPSFPGWWSGHDLDTRHAIGLLDDEAVSNERWLRGEDRDRVRAMVGEADEVETSVRVHAHVARSPCRLMVVQIDDAVGTRDQPNMPGTTDQHPNWRRRMAVPLEELAGHDGLARHAAAMREARPR